MASDINGYQPITKWTNAGSGTAEWCFARKNGQEWFLKRFLRPVYPDKDIAMPGSVRQKKANNFESFKKAKELIYSKVAAASNGNMVLVEELFRSGNHLYLTSERIKHHDNPQALIKALNPAVRMVAARSMVYGVQQLHHYGVVHADLRMENILFKPTLGNHWAAKLIDFENSFLTDKPPSNPETFSMDPVYAAPEVYRFTCNDPIVLGSKMDVYSLALVLHMILVGRLPTFNKTAYNYPFEAIQKGAELDLSTDLPLDWRCMIKQMLELNPANRPVMQVVFETLLHQPVTSASAKPAATHDEKQPVQQVSQGGFRAAPLDISNPW